MEHILGNLTRSLEWMVDCLKIYESLRDGNGKIVRATMIGTKKFQVKMPDGS